MIDNDQLTHDISTQGFHVMDGFLEMHDHHTLYAQAQELHQKGLFRQAKVGSQQQASQQLNIRGDEIYWLDDHAHEPCMQAFIRNIQTIALHVNQAFHWNIAELETHFAAYKPGTFYKKHRDQFRSNQRRKISCVYYLNPEWRESFGGALKLYDHDEALLDTIYPIGNRFICFKSDLLHEVCLTHESRYSIAGWLKAL